MPASTLSGQPLRPMQSLNPREAKVADLADLLIPWFEHLEQSGTIATAAIPTDEEVVAWTQSLFTDHGGRLRVRRTSPKAATNVERAVHGLFRWHQSGGSLEGMFIARWNAGEAWDRVDTYIDVLLVASGRTSPALAAWQRTGLFTARAEEV